MNRGYRPAALSAWEPGASAPAFRTPAPRIRRAHRLEPDSNLIAKKVGTVRRILVASPDYLARRGVRQTPTDLRHHSMIAFSSLMPNREWRFLDGKRGSSISLVPRHEINDAFASIAAAEIGDGITAALSYMVADKIRDGRLAPILDSFAPPPVPVRRVYPQSRMVSPKLRAFVDFAGPRLRATLDRLSLPAPNADSHGTERR